MFIFSFWLKTLQVSNNPIAHERFIVHYQKFLQSIIVEAADRSNHILRASLDEYLVLRRDTIAVKACYDLIILSFDLPMKYLEDHRILKLGDLAIDMICVANVCSINHSRNFFA